MERTKEFAAGFICEAPAFLPAALKDRLTFLSCLSEGENSAVYLCEDKSSGDEVVLKIAKNKNPNSLSREYSLLKNIKHEAVPQAIEQYGIPVIINSDQGSQFTGTEYTELLKSMGIRQSMDGKARWVDNVII